MKKGKSVIALLLILVLLIGGFITYSVVQNLPSKDPEESSTGTTTEYLLELEAKEVASIKLINEEGEFIWETETVNKGEKNEKVELKLTAPAIANLNSTTATSKGNSLLRLRVASVANENAANMADYGLDNPVATATYTLADGTETVVQMGNFLRNEETKAYAKLADSNRVVVVNGLVAMMNIKQADLVSTTILPFELYEIDSFEFIRKSDKMNARIEVFEPELNPDATPTPEPTVTPSAQELNDEAMMRFWRFTEPFEWEADSNDINTLVSELVSVAAAEVLATSIDDPAKYGLDDPSYEYTLHAGEESITVRIGNEISSGKRYLQVSDREDLMTVNMGTYTLIDRPRSDLVNVFVSLINIADLGAIELTTPDGHYDMEVFHPSNAELEENEDLDYIYKINGRDATVVNASDDYYFRKLYSGILSLMVDGEDLEATPGGEPVYSVVITKRTGDKESVAIDLYERNDQSYFLFKDGEYTGFYTRKSRVDNETTNEANLGLIQLLDRMLTAMDNAVDGKYVIPK